MGGGPQVILNYAQNLSRYYNYTVEIITRNIFDDGPFLIKDSIKLIKLGPKTRWNNPLGRIVFLINVYRYLLRKDYDLIHAFPVISGMPCYFAGKLKKIPVVYSVFALQVTNPLLKIYEKPLALIEYIISFKFPYDYLITDNKDIFNKKSRLKKNIFYLENGINIEDFDKVKIPKTTKNRILFVGRFHKQKGIETLMQACVLLKTRIPDFELRMIGYGKEEKPIRSFIKKYNLQSNVSIHAPLYGAKLIREYKQSRFLVLPSLYEGTGIVVLESLAARRPVVITDVGSLRHVITNSTGSKVRPGNAFELYDAIYKMLKSNTYKKGMNGYKLVKEEYQWEKIVKQLNNLYRKIIRPHPLIT